MNPVCQVCGIEQKLIPAGISKSTGKPYSSFFACPNRCPKTKPAQSSSEDMQKMRDWAIKIEAWKMEVEKRLGNLENPNKINF